MVMNATAVTIRHLYEVPDLIPEIARWFVDEWGPYYGPDGPGDAEADLRAASDGDQLPLCLVALDEAGTPVGTISLRAESVPSHKHLTPWIAATLVRPDRRGQGIYTSLCSRRVEQEAKRLGFGNASISRPTSPPTFLERNGWNRIDQAPTLRQTVDVFERRLQSG